MKHAQRQKKKNITTQRKQIYIIIAIITIILLTATGVLGVKIAKNGLSLKGMLMTSIGQDEKDIQNLDPFYCLVMGISEDIEAKLTDTIMLCAYYPNEQKVSILSIPRDTFVGNSTTSADSYDKINALYQTSPEKTLEAVRNLTGIDVRNYVVISNNALRDVVDEIGGVYFDVPMNMNYDDWGQKLHINLKKGYQLLDGDKAEQLVRFRHNNDGTTYPSEYGTQDIGRMRTQREFLKAAATQILSGNNIFKIDDIMQVVFENIETNLKMEDIIKYIPSATEFNPENIQSEMLPGVADYIGVLSFYVNDEEETNALVSSLFGLTEEQIEANKEKFEKESGKKIRTTTNTKNNSSSSKNTTKKNTNTKSTTTNSNKNSSNTNTSGGNTNTGKTPSNPSDNNGETGNSGSESNSGNGSGSNSGSENGSESGSGNGSESGSGSGNESGSGSDGETGSGSETKPGNGETTTE
ncbi:cell envelope-related transcriptional attenuator [Clostridium sp. CAG:354]|jgi:LCP family protein required for cell wall assembly|nr:LCP family protein [Clostridium sp.]MBS5864550.1 LCP family protein [Clostridium sp.]MEE0268810.1 LCP family protein [Clostridia bacterium]CDE10596.1 cell envelope-related transcriptional attenuator [Clostridium sp. CAG:354]